MGRMAVDTIRCRDIMGRYRTEEPRRNILGIRLTDKEMLLIEYLAKELGTDKSGAVREIIFKFAFKLDPVKVKKLWKQLEFEELAENV